MKSPALGVYVHIPFCPSECHYCAFVKQVMSAPGEMLAYVQAVERELDAAARREGLADARVGSVYLGGGTPSLLPADLLVRVLAAVHRVFRVDADAEVTVEVNPGTVTGRSVARWVRAGVNRVSLGAQTLSPARLRLLGRAHTPEDVGAAYAACREAGVASVNVDLLVGLPGETEAEFRRGVERILALGPDHLSLYVLEVEEGTTLARWQARGALRLPDDGEVMRRFAWAVRRAAEAGLERYEISNLARPGHRCRHSVHTWRQGEYLGVGAGAHSHVAGRRWWNVARVDRYVALVQGGRSPVAGEERLSLGERMDEFLFLGLRTVEGISQEEFAARFGYSLEEMYGPALQELEAAGLLHRDGARVRLSEAGLWLHSRVVVTLMGGRREVLDTTMAKPVCSEESLSTR